MFILYNKDGLFFRGDIVSPKGEVARDVHDVENFRKEFEYVLITGYIDEAMIRFEDIQHYRKFLA